MWRLLFTLVVLPLVLPVGAVPQKILVLGDSQSEEYVFEVPFSAPDSDPTHANISNWVEILSAERGSGAVFNEVSFGNYDGSYLAYPDLRDGGYAFNWGVPGFTTSDWVSVRNQDSLPFPPTGSEAVAYASRIRIVDQLEGDVGWAVIFCGGNDVNGDYGDYYKGTVTNATLDGIRYNLKKLILFIKSTNPAVKIVLVNVPDVGVTPNVFTDPNHLDPAKRATATAKIALLNNWLAALAASENVALVDYFGLTRQIAPTFEPGDFFYLNGTAFHKAADPENPPNYLFAKDGFHPSTVAQALVANLILDAMNDRYGTNFTLLPNREILSDVLGLDPDQPFLDWKSAHGVTGTAAADPDHDGVPLLVEFACGLDPAEPGPPPWTASPSAEPGTRMVFSFPGDQSHGYALTTPEWSADLAPASWQPVPSSWLAADGIRVYVKVPAAAGPRAFVRLRAAVAP